MQPLWDGLSILRRPIINLVGVDCRHVTERFQKAYIFGGGSLVKLQIWIRIFMEEKEEVEPIRVHFVRSISVVAPTLWSVTWYRYKGVLPTK